MESFLIEHDHTDAQIPEFAARCGCPKCERYRTTHVEPARTVTLPAAGLMLQKPAPGSVPPGVRQPIPVENMLPGPTSATAPTIAVSAFCTCPIGTRGANTARGCATCGKPRRPQPAAAPRNVVRDLDAQHSPDAELTSLRALAAHQNEEIAQLKRQLATQRGYIAGASSVAAGKFFGFGGQGSMERGALLAIINRAGLSIDIAPGVKSAHAQAGDAVGKLNGRGYVVRTDRARPAAGETRTWKARWIVAQQVGAGFPVLGTVAITTDGRLEFGPSPRGTAFPAQLADGIRVDFEATVSGEVYDATDVSTWLRGVIVKQFRAAAVGQNFYVRSRHVDAAERLCSALSKTWGRAWLLPAVPMVASDELAEGIVQGFLADAEAVMDTFITERDAIDTETGKPVGIGKRRAAGLLSQVRELIERCAGFASMFGEKRTVDVKRKLVAVAEEIQASTDDISTRFGLIFEELARDSR